MNSRSVLKAALLVWASEGTRSASARPGLRLRSSRDPCGSHPPTRAAHPINWRLRAAACVAAALVAGGLTRAPRAQEEADGRAAYGAQDALRDTELLLARVFPEAICASLSCEPHDDAPTAGAWDRQCWQVQALDRNDHGLAQAIWDARTRTLLFFSARPSCQPGLAGAHPLDRGEVAAAAHHWLAALGLGGTGTGWLLDGPPEPANGQHWRVCFRARGRAAYVLLDRSGRLLHATDTSLLPLPPHPTEDHAPGQAALRGPVQALPPGH